MSEKLRRGDDDVEASAGDAGVADERPADSTEARRAPSLDRAVPLGQPKHQGDHGDCVRHAESADAAAARLECIAKLGIYDSEL